MLKVECISEEMNCKYFSNKKVNNSHSVNKEIYISSITYTDDYNNTHK